MQRGMDGDTTAHSKVVDSKINGVERRDGRRSWALERSLLAWAYNKVGRPAVTLQLWDGTVLGQTQSAVGRLVIHSPAALHRIALNPNLAFGECFTEGTLTIDGDLIAVLIEINRGLTRAGFRRSDRGSGGIRRRKHSLAESKSSVEHHYNLGNDFYRLWLDEQLVYTCAYYTHPTATLEEAQVAKLDYVCRKLRLKPGERVVEAGCGWGALALHMARNYGVSVRAYNLSREQITVCRERAAAEGLNDSVQFIEGDYREIAGEFDAFVSIGMLEHVGLEKYRELGALMSRVLTNAGRGLIHTIGRNVARPLDPWTSKYIFPGAHPPSLREMMDLFEQSGFSVLDVENLRLHYQKTCADWSSRFDAVSEQVAKIFDDHFIRMWRLYLAASSASFENGDLQLFQVVFSRSNNNSLLWTRADWYATPIAAATSS